MMPFSSIAFLNQLIISQKSPSIRFKMPMDPNIKIHSAALGNGVLLLKGQAVVTP